MAALTGLGSSLVDLRQPEAAITRLERALAILAERKESTQPEFRAAAECALARALWALSRDHKRALELARRARDIFAKHPDSKRMLDAVKSWMRRR